MRRLVGLGPRWLKEAEGLVRAGAPGGSRNQIALVKEFAGRTVVVDSSEPGVWVIKTARTIPDSELRLHQPEAAGRLDRAWLVAPSGHSTAPDRAADASGAPASRRSGLPLSW